jgi:hypothetical protein
MQFSRQFLFGNIPKEGNAHIGNAWLFLAVKPTKMTSQENTG